MTTRTFRLLGLAVALPLFISACSDHPGPGAVNVELGSFKGEYVSEHQGVRNGDSLAAGLSRNTTNQPTGKQLYKAAGQSRDRNHDGVAD